MIHASSTYNFSWGEIYSNMKASKLYNLARAQNCFHKLTETQTATWLLILLELACEPNKLISCSLSWSTWICWTWRKMSDINKLPLLNSKILEFCILNQHTGKLYNNSSHFLFFWHPKVPWKYKNFWLRANTHKTTQPQGSPHDVSL